MLADFRLMDARGQPMTSIDVEKDMSGVNRSITFNLHTTSVLKFTDKDELRALKN
jgi:hypothetical protein